MRALIILALLTQPAPSAPQPAAAGSMRDVEDHPPQVIAIYSTRRDAQLSIVGDRELPRLLEDGLNGRIDYYSEFIDPQRFAEPRYQTTLSEFLRLKYRDRRFDLVLAIDDGATNFVAEHRDVFSGSPPVVFFASSRGVGKPADSTGVIAEINLAGTVSLASSLDPDLRHLFVVIGAEKSDESFARTAQAQFRVFEPRVEFTYLAGLPTSALAERLRALPAHSAVYYLSVGRDGGGNYVHPLHYLDTIVGAANAPTYSWVDSTMGRGIVGGSLKSQSAQIAALAHLGVRVLRGEPIETIPLALRDLNVVQVDWRQLRRWGLRESRLPAGTSVLFRDPSPWERYRLYILTALMVLVAQTALIAGLLIQRRQRRQAERRVIESRAELRASYDRIRDLGGRLLKAQESERSHIARELHDDAGQQLALIEMDLKLLGGGARSNADLAAETLDRVRSVSRSIRELSHRLHPAKLRLIGLVVALKGLEAEMSQPGMDVVFTHEGVPSSLPPDVTLCLFRIAQEALQNARKYSGARRVSVHLSAGPAGLSLTIVDDGAGFDVAGAWARGLGLVSMKERVEAIGGAMVIRSAPGAGTLVQVTAPLGGVQSGSVAV
jgi:signal transduction histidine kinase